MPSFICVRMFFSPFVLRLVPVRSARKSCFLKKQLEQIKYCCHGTVNPNMLQKPLQKPVTLHYTP